MRVFYKVLTAAFYVAIMAIPALSFASGNDQYYYQARVEAVQWDALSIKILNGPDKGKVVTAGTTGLNSYSDISLPKYRVGDVVITSASPGLEGSSTYAVVDHYRLPNMAILLVILAAAAIIFAGWRGVGSLLGLGISLFVIAGFIIPSILHGGNPYIISIVGSFVIAGLTMFLAHGLSRRTVLALIGTCLTLLTAVGLSVVAVGMSHLNGIASEDVSYLHQQLPALNLKGILLGGVIIGVLGVLDDITIGQAAAVEELRKANDRLGWRELYKSASLIGREHIASLINTLVLAYAGSAFVFIVYVASVQNTPLWLTLNSELVTEEIIRSVVGSLSLILGVPIATLLSAYFLTNTWRQAVGAFKRRVTGKFPT